jgi:hypothetical protein
MFSAQYAITTTPREARGWGSGGSITIFAAGSVPVSGMTPAGLHVCVALCARAVLAHSIMTATDSISATFSAASFSVIMIFAPLIRDAFDTRDHTGSVGGSRRRVRIMAVIWRPR